MKTNNKIFYSILFFLLFIELFSRFYLGLGELPVYIEDEDFEYIYAPNQNVSRFGNRIETNEFSMRSKPLTEKDEVRILKIGDSVINGGARTDQDSLASSILEKQLSGELNTNIRVLNVGANSWGPDNAFAYIKKYGHFDVSMIVMVFSSHDYYDHMHFQKVVGIHTSWPSDQPFSALTDGINKYFVPWVKKLVWPGYNQYEYLEEVPQNPQMNTGWDDLIKYSGKHQVPLLVYLHPTVQELESGKYDRNGEKIITFLKENEVRFIPGIDGEIEKSCYRDHIHLNEKGQKILADILFLPLKAHIEQEIP